MRFIPALLSCLTIVTFANGEAFQYSPGWSPGQATKATPSASTAVPFKPSSSGGQFSWTSLLTSGPLGTLFARSGINMTERVTEAQRKANMLPWDDRIPMITDDNFEQLIFNETFATPEEEEARLWFLVVYATRWILCLGSESIFPAAQLQVAKGRDYPLLSTKNSTKRTISVLSRGTCQMFVGEESIILTLPG